jgi:hypothetical protein
MAKKRKTREQKKLADLRHNFTHSLENSTTFEAKYRLQPKTSVAPLVKTKTPTSQSLYPYLAKDLTKTGLLTAGIVFFQITLFILLKNHILTIPGLSY